MHINLDSFKVEPRQTILHVIPTLEGGGAERQLAMLAVEQARRGWAVHVAVRRTGIYEEALRLGGVMIHALADRRGLNLFLFWRLVRLIEALEPDFIQTWLPQMDIVGGAAAVFHRLRWIATERSSLLAYAGSPGTTWLRLRMIHLADCVIANSRNGVAYWQRSGHQRSVFQIDNAVDVQAIRKAAEVNLSIAKTQTEVPNILVVGRLHSGKGLETVIEAIRLLPSSSGIRVLIIGDGPLRRDLESAIRQADLGDVIHLLPYQASWWGLLKDASALINLSSYEGQPNVVLEAMAGGCPLIVSDIDAHREFLSEDAAIFVPLGNPMAVTDAIAAVLSAPEAARRRAKVAAAHVDGMSIRLAADAYESIYYGLLVK